MGTIRSYPTAEFPECDATNNFLREVAVKTHKERFEAGYPVNDQTLNESLGIAIAHYCGYAGVPIMEIFMGALEDANYHNEAGIVSAWIAQRQPRSLRERLLDYHNVDGVPTIALEMARAYKNYKNDPVAGEIAVQFFRGMFPEDKEYYNVINGIIKHSGQGR